MGHVYNVLAQWKISGRPKYYSERLIIEQCENIHLHLRNMRLEFSPREYANFCSIVADSMQRYQEVVGEEIEVPLGRIVPFDDSHKESKDGFDCGKETQSHRDGVDLVKLLLQSDKYEINPIAVRNMNENGLYERLDGFKRYWACKELGYETVKVAVMKEDIPGCQRGLPLVRKK